MAKLNLSLVRKLIDALEKSQKICDDMASNPNTSDVEEYAIEMSRSYGIAMGIMQEGAMLAGDVQELLKLTTSSKSGSATANYMETLMAEIKGNTGGKSGKN